jgi:SNF2 family DNA or RNA helicase
MEIIDEAGDDKIIIFTQFKSMARILAREIEEAGYAKPLLLTGDNNQEERAKGIEDFKAGKYQVLIATEIFSYVMNLQFADVLINYDIPWNPARLNQRIDRIHRIGATRGKIIVNLIAEDIEQTVYAVLQSKQDLFDQVVDGKAISDDSTRKEILQKLMGE